jgi:peroxiredoxin
MRERGIRYLTLAALAAALSLVIVLAKQKREMQLQALEHYNQAVKPHVGFLVPTFRSVALNGDSVTVGAAAPGTKQVLFVFTTTCPFCKSTLPAWREITRRLSTSSAGQVAVLGISADSEAVTREYVETNRISFRVLRFPDHKLLRLYRAGAVPMTAVTDHEGRMLYVPHGMIAGAAIDSVVAAALDTSRVSEVAARLALPIAEKGGRRYRSPRTKRRRLASSIVPPFSMQEGGQDAKQDLVGQPNRARLCSCGHSRIWRQRGFRKRARDAHSRLSPMLVTGAMRGVLCSKPRYLHRRRCVPLRLRTDAKHGGIRGLHFRCSPRSIL